MTDIDATAAPQPDATAAPQPSFKVFVSYVYVRAEDKQERHGRLFITATLDIFAQVQVEQLEAQIAEMLNRNGPFAAGVTLLNWKRLAA